MEMIWFIFSLMNAAGSAALFAVFLWFSHPARPAGRREIAGSAEIMFKNKNG
jgi:hypothetical protein